MNVKNIGKRDGNDKIKRVISLTKEQIKELRRICQNYGIDQKTAFKEIFYLGVITCKYYRRLNFRTYDQFDQFLDKILPKNPQQVRLQYVHDFTKKLRETGFSEDVLKNLEILLESIVVEEDEELIIKLMPIARFCTSVQVSLHIFVYRRRIRSFLSKYDYLTSYISLCKFLEFFVRNFSLSTQQP